MRVGWWPGGRPALFVVALFASAAAALGLAACGGGGGGSSPSEPPMPPPGIQFTAAGLGGANSISLGRGAGTTADRLMLEVRANQVTGLYGVAFDLSIPAGILAFTGTTEGTFLGSDGTATSIQVSETPGGNLVVGATRLGPVSGISGSGVLITFELTASSSGSGSFTFTENAAYSADGQVQGDVTWEAGSVQVNR